MPRRRAKPFIDKKDSECFTLVARSQLDPLFYDDAAPKNVLVSSAVRAVGDKFAQPRASGAGDDADDARSAATGRGSVATRATKKSGRWGGGRRGAEDDARSTVSTRSRARVMDVMAAPVGAAGARRIHELSEVDEQGFPLDGYDYSQHLTEGGDSGVFIAASGEVYASGVHFTHARAAQFNLPQEVLPCKPEDEVDRMLEAIVLKPESMPADLREVMDAIEEAEEELDAEDFGAFVIDPADVVGSTSASAGGAAGVAAGAGAADAGAAGAAAPAPTTHKPVRVKQRVQRGTHAFDVEELDDEFVLQATGEVEYEGGDAVDEPTDAGGAAGGAAASKMSKNSKYREPAEFDFEAHMARLMAAAEGKWTDTNDDFDEDDDFYGGEEEEEEEEEYKRSAHAASSGVTRRDAGGVRYSDALLNAVMAQYEDDQIGELDENDPRLRSDAAWLAFGNNAALANAKRLAEEEAGEEGEYDEHAGFDEREEDAFLEAGEEEEEEDDDDALPEALPINNDQLLERLVSDYLIEKEENRRDMLLMNGVGVRTDRKRATASKAPLHPEDVLRVPKRDAKSGSSVAGSSSSGAGAGKPAGSSAFGINFGALAALSASGTKAAVPVRVAGAVESKAGEGEAAEAEAEAEEDDDYMSADDEHASHHGYSEGEEEEEEDEAERIMRDRTGYQLDEHGNRIIPFGFGEGDFVYDETIPALPLPKEKPRWDAETIVSTYTNTENHPRPLTDGVSITSSRTGFMAKSLASAGDEAAGDGAAHSKNMLVSSYGTPVIRLSKKTGLPVRSAPSAKVAAARAASRLAAQPIAEEAEDVEEADGSASEEESGVVTKRNKDETAEEKRARKAAAKNARRERRADKKVLRDAYKYESLRQSAMAHARNAVASGATLE